VLSVTARILQKAGMSRWQPVVNKERRRVGDNERIGNGKHEKFASCDWKKTGKERRKAGGIIRKMSRNFVFEMRGDQGMDEKLMRWRILTGKQEVLSVTFPNRCFEGSEWNVMLRPDGVNGL
jgi:hypothetical protein